MIYPPLTVGELRARMADLPDWCHVLVVMNFTAADGSDYTPEGVVDGAETVKDSRDYPQLHLLLYAEDRLL